MNRLGQLAIGAGVLSLVMFGAGGLVATAHERELQAQAVSQPLPPEVKTVTKVVTRHQTVTTSVLSEDCELLVEHTRRLYKSIEDFNTSKAEIQFLLDTIGSAMIRNDKAQLNKAHEKLREIDLGLSPVFEDITQAEYSAELYQGRCKGN